MQCQDCQAENAPGAVVCIACGNKLDSSLANSLIDLLKDGQELQDGRFVIRKLLGRGGFGITYKCDDTKTGKPVAIKEFFPEGCQRQGLTLTPTRLSTEDYRNSLNSFLDEARTIAKFEHECIVKVHTSFEENGTGYMVMDFLDGQTLSEKLDGEGSMIEEDAVALTMEIADALTVIHSMNLLHRDVKPGNIILTKEGGIVLIDFGSAREFVDEKTKSMTRLVTPGYAPLEQRSAEGRFGPFTDIYSLGATLYHMLVGEVPVDALDRIQGVELKSPRQRNSEISVPVSNAVMKAMSIKAPDRPKSVKLFRRSLRSREGIDSALAGDPKPDVQPQATTYGVVQQTGDGKQQPAIVSPSVPSWQRPPQQQDATSSTIHNVNQPAPFVVNSAAEMNDEGIFQSIPFRLAAIGLVVVVLACLGIFVLRPMLTSGKTSTPTKSSTAKSTGISPSTATKPSQNTFWAAAETLETSPKGAPRRLKCKDFDFSLDAECTNAFDRRSFSQRTNNDGDIDTEITTLYYREDVIYSLTVDGAPNPHQFPVVQGANQYLYPQLAAGKRVVTIDMGDIQPDLFDLKETNSTYFKRKVDYEEKGKKKTRYVRVEKRTIEIVTYSYPRGKIKVFVWDDEALALCDKYSKFDAKAAASLNFDSFNDDPDIDELPTTIIGLCQEIASLDIQLGKGKNDFYQGKVGFQGTSSDGVKHLKSLDANLSEIEKRYLDFKAWLSIEVDEMGFEEERLADYYKSMLVVRFCNAFEEVYQMYWRDSKLENPVYFGMKDHLEFVTNEWPDRVDHIKDVAHKGELKWMKAWN